MDIYDAAKLTFFSKNYGASNEEFNAWFKRFEDNGYIDPDEDEYDPKVAYGYVGSRIGYSDIDMLGPRDFI